MEPWLKPMLCTAIDDIPIGDYVAEAKHDGWRFLVHSTGRGCLAYAGRNGSDYSGKLPYIEAELAKCLPADSAVDGELIGVGWSDVQSVMTTNGGPHIPTKGTPPLRYVVFDILRCDGQDVRSLPWHERRSLLEAATFVEHVTLSEIFPANERTFQVALATGFEGIVCKERNSKYVNGRSLLWPKLKPQETAEAIVTGFKDGNGAFQDMIGAIEFEMLDDNDRPTGAISRASGMNMQVRRDMTDNPDAWIGQVIEIRHHGIGTSGKPRHPVFARRRDDKMTQSRPARKAPTVRNQVNAAIRQGTWVRNYGAMGVPKLRGALDDFARGHGDAVDRVTQRGGDLKLNVARAKEAATSKGLPIPAGL